MNLIDSINQLTAKRRSVYPSIFTGEEVDDLIIGQMLENANWAPNHKLTEPWRFTVFKGEGIKQLAKYQSERYKRESEAEDSFDPRKYENLGKKPLLSSHIISIGVKSSGLVREIEEIEAVACAVQNMYLTACAYEIGCYWGTGGITYMKGSNEFFGLGESDKLLGFLYCGIPKKYPQKGVRKPVSEKVRWVTS